MNNKFIRKIVVLQLAMLILTLLPTSLAQAFINNGPNAVDLLGQYENILLPSPQPNYGKGAENDGPNLLTFEGPMEIDTVHHRFFLGVGSAVMVYNLNIDNSFPDKIPDNILGQPNFTSVASATTQSGLGLVSDLAYDSANNRLFVAQSTNHRVTVFDVTSIANGENAINVLGQADFTSGTSSTAQNRFNSPNGLAYDSTHQRLFVMQQSNHRVTVFDVSTITDGENATNVLGQTNFTNATAATSQGRLNSPRGIAYDETNQRLFVSQQSANRISIFDVVAITNGENAVNVLGQANFTDSSSTTTQAGLNIPQGIDFDSAKGYLLVTQLGGHRVSIFDVNAVTNGENAINVLGQNDFTSATEAVTQNGMGRPIYILSDSANELVYVSEATGHRVTVYNINSITNGENAVDLFGQYDDSLNPIYTKGGPNNGPNKWGFYGPTSITMDHVHHRLFISDSYNNRVLVHTLNTDDTLIDKVPDFVLGQPDLLTNTMSISQTGMFYPMDLAYDSVHDRLFVINDDFDRGRVLVYDTASITNGEAAVNVLGQEDFTSTVTITSQDGMRNPWGMVYDETGDRLFVGDWGNARVLVFDTTSITNGEDAINVLGQPDFITNTQLTTQSRMGSIAGLAYDSANHRLFVSDWTNSRVMVFDVTSITNGENATNVLGQPNFTNSADARSTVRMELPETLAFDPDDKRLFVSDGTNRVMVFDAATISNAEPSINVLGQSTFTSSATGTTQSLFDQLSGIFYDTSNDLLYAVDGSGTIYGASGNNRIMLFDAETVPTIIATESDDSTVVYEGGADDSFDVTLSKAPTAPVIINVVSNHTLAADVSTSSLTFTDTTWNVPQTVTVSAPQDANLISEFVSVSLSVNTGISDPEWANVAGTFVGVNVIDDEADGFRITEIDNPVDIAEGASDDFQVVLTAEPDPNAESSFLDVVLNISSSDPLAADVSTPTLTFTSEDWDTPQTVNISALEDANEDNEFVSINIEVDTAISNPDFENVSPQSIDVNTLDNDSSGGGGGDSGSSSGEQSIVCDTSGGIFISAVTPEVSFESRTVDFQNEAPADLSVSLDAGLEISVTDTRGYDPDVSDCGGPSTLSIQSGGLVNGVTTLNLQLGSALTSGSLGCTTVCTPDVLDDVATVTGHTGPIGSSVSIVEFSEAFGGTIRAALQNGDLQVTPPTSSIPSGTYTGTITFTLS